MTTITPTSIPPLTLKEIQLAGEIEGLKAQILLLLTNNQIEKKNSKEVESILFQIAEKTIELEKVTTN